MSFLIHTFSHLQLTSVVSFDSSPSPLLPTTLRLWNSTLLKEKGDTLCSHAFFAWWGRFLSLYFVLESWKYIETLEFSQSFACLKKFLTYTSYVHLKLFFVIKIYEKLSSDMASDIYGRLLYFSSPSENSVGAIRVYLVGRK